jgi:hypothetical protein
MTAGRNSNAPFARLLHVVAGLVGVGALLGTGRNVHKARASRANGRLGGRPRIGDHRPARLIHRDFPLRCSPVVGGSPQVRCSPLPVSFRQPCAGVAKLADAQDLKNGQGPEH